jgi:hypothetical protein
MTACMRVAAKPSTSQQITNAARDIESALLILQDRVPSVAQWIGHTRKSLRYLTRQAKKVARDG